MSCFLVKLMWFLYPIDIKEGGGIEYKRSTAQYEKKTQ